MLRLFSSIRKTLLSENKTVRYLQYAFGEIILIVVGIMIALQINNWNQHQSNLDLERNFLQRFHTDLEEDLVNFTEQVEIGTQGLAALKKAVALMQKENVEDDFYTLNRLYDLAHLDSFIPQYSTYQELESTGRLNLIRDEALRLAILKHYAKYERLEAGFEGLYVWRKNVTHGFDAETSTLKYVDWNKSLFPPEVRSEKDWAFLNNADHPEFEITETALAATGFWISWHLEDYADIIPETQALKNQIAEALEAL